jgi:hypothetical protein
MSEEMRPEYDFSEGVRGKHHRPKPPAPLDELSITKALEDYQKDRVTKTELCRVLEFKTRIALDGFLKARGVCDNYTIEDLEAELRDAKKLGH